MLSMLKADSLSQHMVRDSLIGTEEATRHLNSIGNNGGEVEEAAPWTRGWGINGQERVALARVSLDIDGVGKSIVAEQKVS